MTAVARKQLPLRPAGPDTVEALLAWYDEERRDLPWRVAPGKRADPYRVWLSEIMLQQTTVKAVIPFYLRFLARWPTVDGARRGAARRRARRLGGARLLLPRAQPAQMRRRRCARSRRSVFPAPSPSCRSCPASVPTQRPPSRRSRSARPATPVDGNIERVVARLFAVRQPLPAAKSELKRLAATLTPARRAGDFAQAMMDLGAGICTPRRPSCLVCPVQQDCAGAAHGIAASLPMRLERNERPQRVGFAFVALREDGHVLLRRRPEAGLLGGMLEVPGTAWGDLLPPAKEALRSAPLRADWWAVPATVVHVFTHFRLELIVYRALVPADATLTFWAEPERCRWVARRDLHAAAVPSVMRKVIAHALKEN